LAAFEQHAPLHFSERVIPNATIWLFVVLISDLKRAFPNHFLLISNDASPSLEARISFSFEQAPSSTKNVMLSNRFGWSAYEPFDVLVTTRALR
jgi:hypothetical protein